MKLIIDIDEKDYKEFKKHEEDMRYYADENKLVDRMELAILDGIPLDNLRAEIVEEKECAYADFELYKVEYLEQDWNDVYDSLPQDDYRYGMERCIELIDKYKNEVSK